MGNVALILLLAVISTLHSVSAQNCERIRGYAERKRLSIGSRQEGLRCSDPATSGTPAVYAVWGEVGARGAVTEMLTQPLRKIEQVRSLLRIDKSPLVDETSRAQFGIRHSYYRLEHIGVDRGAGRKMRLTDRIRRRRDRKGKEQQKPGVGVEEEIPRHLWLSLLSHTIDAFKAFKQRDAKRGRSGRRSKSSARLDARSVYGLGWEVQRHTGEGMHHARDFLSAISQ